MFYLKYLTFDLGGGHGAVVRTTACRTEFVFGFRYSVKKSFLAVHSIRLHFVGASVTKRWSGKG